MERTSISSNSEGLLNLLFRTCPFADLQLIWGSKLMLAGSNLERERAKALEQTCYQSIACQALFYYPVSRRSFQSEQQNHWSETILASEPWPGILDFCRKVKERCGERCGGPERRHGKWVKNEKSETKLNHLKSQNLSQLLKSESPLIFEKLDKVLDNLIAFRRRPVRHGRWHEGGYPYGVIARGLSDFELISNPNGCDRSENYHIIPDFLMFLDSWRFWHEKYPNNQLMVVGRLGCLWAQVQAMWLTLERIVEIQRETKTFLVFDTGRPAVLLVVLEYYCKSNALQGGGSYLQAGKRRLLVCGGTELRRAEAAARAREHTERDSARLPPLQVRENERDQTKTFIQAEKLKVWSWHLKSKNKVIFGSYFAWFAMVSNLALCVCLHLQIGESVYHEVTATANTLSDVSKQFANMPSWAQ